MTVVLKILVVPVALLHEISLQGPRFLPSCSSAFRRMWPSPIWHMVAHHVHIPASGEEVKEMGGSTWRLHLKLLLMSLWPKFSQIDSHLPREIDSVSMGNL